MKTENVSKMEKKLEQIEQRIERLRIAQRFEKIENGSSFDYTERYYTIGKEIEDLEAAAFGLDDKIAKERDRIKADGRRSSFPKGFAMGSGEQAEAAEERIKNNSSRYFARQDPESDLWNIYDRETANESNESGFDCVGWGYDPDRAEAAAKALNTGEAFPSNAELAARVGPEREEKTLDEQLAEARKARGDTLSNLLKLDQIKYDREYAKMPEVFITFQGLVFMPKHKETFAGFNWKNFKRGENVYNDVLGWDDEANHGIFDFWLESDPQRVFLEFRPESPRAINRFLQNVECRYINELH